MRKTIQISSFQMIAIMFNFLLGWPIIYGITKESEQNAWIAILTLTFCGIIQFLFYYFLFCKRDSKTFIEVIQYSFGKYLGMIVSYIYIFYFVYITAITVSDYAFLIRSTLLLHKSYLILSLTFLVVLLFACYVGLEAFARTSELLFFVFLGFLFLSIFLAIINKQIDITNTLPIYDVGKSIKSIFPVSITIPFGELMVLSTLFSHIKKKESFPIKGVISIFLLGCMAAFVTFIIIGMIGPQLLRDSNYPIIEALKKIYILDIIQRFDVAGVIIFMICGFIKAGVYLIAASTSLLNLHPKISITPILICFGIIILSITLYMTKDYPRFAIISVKKNPYLLHLPLQIFVPVLIAIILFVKKLLRNQNKNRVNIA